MEFVTSCIGPVFTALASWGTPNLKHMWYFNENVVEFRKKKVELENKGTSVQMVVKGGRKNRKEETAEVKSWIKEYEGIKKECNDLDNQVREYARIQICKFSQKVVTMTDRINKHIDQTGKFILMSVDQPPPNVEKVNTKYKDGLHSVEETKKAVYAALKKESVIGLWGMGGIGKTTLMQSINNEMAERSDFKYVIMVTVSSSPDIKKIQDEIGRRLQLNLGDSTEIHRRAYTLSERLKNGQSILIILDDVWKKLDLGEVGIPGGGGGENQCCKIVLTTRKKDVCKQMDAASIIPMACLDPIESWNLFERIAGKIVESKSINGIAKDVCDQCSGLPLAISVAATTLKNEDNEYMWRDFLANLKESDSGGLDDLEEKVFNVLKLSYDHLRNDDLKLCFLFCSLFPEDHEIHSSDLIYYGIGEGFLACREGSTSLDACRIFLHKLKACGLLEANRDEMYVRMHDVVRHMAIRIAEEKYFFIEAGVGLTEWPPRLEKEEKRRGLKYISLMENSIQEITHRPQNGEGVTLLSLKDNKELKSIHSDFLEGMQNLLVLDLRGTSMSELTPCIQKLKNLRVLMFESVEWYKEILFVNIEDLLNLRNLSVLCLKFTYIPELKEEFGELVHLRVIDFSFTVIDIIRPKVFSRLRKLEVLRMNGSFSGWKASSNEEDGDLVAFVELASLKHMHTLEVNIYDEYIFSDEYTLVECFPSVKYFQIRSCSGKAWNFEDISSRILVLQGNIQLKNIAKWLKVLLNKTELLLFRGISNDDLSSLEQLNINGGTNLVDAVLEPDTMKVMHNLVHLGVSGYPKYKKFFQYSSNTEGDEPILPKLEIMRLWSLDGLDTVIVTPSLLPDDDLSSLEQLNINGGTNLVDAVLEPDTMKVMHNLVCLVVSGHPKYKKVFQYSSNTEGDEPILPKLEIMRLWSLDGLDTVIVTSSLLPAGSFKSLRYVYISACHKLRFVFTWSMALCLVQLICLNITGCDELKHIIGKDGYDHNFDSHSRAQVFPKLEELSLNSLPKLESVWQKQLQENMQMQWSSLEDLEVAGCKNLRRLFLGEQSAPALKKLKCEEEWFQNLNWEDEQEEIKRRALRIRINTAGGKIS